MPGSSKHSWNFEVLDPRSRWLFIHPSEFAESLGLYIMELGDFLQDGKCYTSRAPESSFCLNFVSENQEFGENRNRLCFPDCSYEIPIYPREHSVSIIDNRLGYSMEHNFQCESYFIQFGGVMAEKYCTALLDGRRYREFPIIWHPYLLETFEKLVLLYRQPSNEKRDVYASMLLLGLLSRLLLEAEPTQPLYAENHYVRQTLEILSQRFYEPLRLQDIARELHVNSNYLSHLIASETGITFSKCLTHMRINHSKKLLQTTGLSIEEIGAKCGFCNASHFVKLFHASEGLTPLQYRTQRRQDV